MYEKIVYLILKEKYIINNKWTYTFNWMVYTVIFMIKKQSSKKNPLIDFEDILENHITLSISERN